MAVSSFFIFHDNFLTGIQLQTFLGDEKKPVN